MSSDGWKNTTLEEVADIIIGQSPSGENCNVARIGIPLLNGPAEFGSYHPTPMQFTTTPKKIAEIGDILFCVKGSTIGKMNWADQRYAIGWGLAAIRHKKGKDFQPFLKGMIEYYLPNLLKEATGSAFPNISSQQLNKLEFNIPESVEIQTRMAAILSTFDEKIELNYQTNFTLETIAQAIFKEWFIDFRFPGSNGNMEESDLGLIPVGWKVISFDDELEVERGLSYEGTGLTTNIDKNTPMHNLNSINEGGGYKFEGIKYYSGEYKKKHIVKPGDLIIVNTEQGHKYLHIGYPAIVPSFFGELGIYSHHVYRLRPKQSSFLTTDFLYHLLLQPDIRRQVVSFSNGTTVNMLRVEGLQKPMFALPPIELVSRFSNLAMNIRLKQEEAIEQTITLGKIRDTVLPKLMSGDFKV